jgi:predicted enzyme related to lactoylglutathione lyase
MATPKMSLRSIVLDCADPSGLAEFYGRLLDSPFDTSDPQWCDVYLSYPHGPKLSFQLAPDHVVPQWPDGQPQQVHLDFQVDEFEATAAWALELGASQLSGQVDDEDGGGSFVVFADPAGHPFCLVRAQEGPQ